MKIPDFFIVGAPKCGTTALFEYLRHHPQVFIPELKEPHFFCTDFPDYRRIQNMDAYCSLFAEAEDKHRAIGEASVFYLYSKDAVPALFELNRQSKIIVMLRNPVDMVYSYHSQLLYSMRENVKDFGAAWALQGQRSSGASLPPHCLAPEHLQYSQVASLGSQMKRLYLHVPKRQVKAIVFDDFLSSPLTVYREVLEFLGLPWDGRTEFQAVNQNKAPRLAWLNSLLMHPPFPLDVAKHTVRRAFGLDVHRRFSRTIYHFLSQKQARPPMSSSLRSQLCDHFRGEVEVLQEILGRDLSHWTALRSYDVAPVASTAPHAVR